MHPKDQNGTQCREHGGTKIESIEELLRQRGFFDTLGRDEIERNEKNVEVLVS